MANLKFIRHAPNRKKRLGRYWRKPKGLDNKLRWRVNGHGLSVSIGYGRKRSDLGKLRNGLRERRIENMQDVALLNSKEEAAVLSGTLGLQRKAELVGKLVEKHATILNMKDPAGFLSRIAGEMAARKQKPAKEKTKGGGKQGPATAAEPPKAAGSPEEAGQGGDELAQKVEDEEKARKKEYEKTLTKRM
ncbi:MAG TPA: eL32 family ribosomal protein [Candidatus Nanoarchaeia archaeon]|nr:eL32 family ribosomal protein [Candidatus Nanoarchaeia archaeon]